MTLNAGSQLGPYEILQPIDAGGMGEVYRAKDRRLDRTVAIKVLPSHFSTAESKQRFEREAKTIATLNHPHICTLYDVGNQDGLDYLVMEYLDGVTLASKLSKGPLPLEEALRYATEIADALDQAHRHSVVHRDLKPGNVMITPSGAKLLDFGLAKIAAAPGAPAAMSSLPTENPAVTTPGTILGTFQYMAPEQLEGKEADARTDIFAFGAVVYEMITGRKAFEGKSQASLIAAIIERDPPALTELQPVVPAALDRVVKKCLAKDPDRRWQSAHDLADELQWVAGSQGPDVGSKSVVVGRRSITRALVGVAVFLAGALVAGSTLMLWERATNAPAEAVRFSITLPSADRLGDAVFGAALQLISVSPDGTRLLYNATRDGKSNLWLRTLDQLEPVPISGTDGALGGGAFSPDGEWIAFSADNKLKKVPVTGGVPVVLSDVWVPSGVSWGSDGTIVFVPSVNSGILKVSAQGGQPTPITSVDVKNGEASHTWPEILPDGESVLFTVELAGKSFDDARIDIVSLVDGERHTVIERGTVGRYASTGHLLYGRGGSLLAVPFDPSSGMVNGSPQRVADGVMLQHGIGAVQFAVSKSGSLMYVPGGVFEVQGTVVAVDRKGTVQPLSVERRQYRKLALSPNGSRLALEIGAANNDIWLSEPSRGILTRLTFAEGENQYPVWQPGSARIAFASDRGGGVFNVFWMPADRSSAVEQLTKSERQQLPTSFSPDGRWLAYEELSSSSGWDVWVLSLTGDRKPQAFVSSAYNEQSAFFSPDGSWITYSSNESGRDEIYVQPFPGPGAKYQVSANGGIQPRWAPNGRELFYRQGNKMIAAPVTLKPSFTAGNPTELFSTDSQPVYQVFPDSERFLMIRDDSPLPRQINVVLNWFEELQQRVGR